MWSQFAIFNLAKPSPTPPSPSCEVQCSLLSCSACKIVFGFKIFWRETSCVALLSLYRSVLPYCFGHPHFCSLAASPRSFEFVWACVPPPRTGRSQAPLVVRFFKVVATRWVRSSLVMENVCPLAEQLINTPPPGKLAITCITQLPAIVHFIVTISSTHAAHHIQQGCIHPGTLGSYRGPIFWVRSPGSRLRSPGSKYDYDSATSTLTESSTIFLYFLCLK